MHAAAFPCPPYSSHGKMNVRCEGDAEWREKVTHEQLFVSGVQVVFFLGRKTVGFCPRLLMHPKVTVVN